MLNGSTGRSTLGEEEFLYPEEPPIPRCSDRNRAILSLLGPYLFMGHNAGEVESMNWVIRHIRESGDSEDPEGAPGTSRYPHRVATPVS